MNDFFNKNKISDDKIVVGVSGGADSLALVIMLKEWANKNNRDIIAITVDHKLRDESTSEANYVANIMKNFDIEHHILTWEGDKPKTGIEEAARTARYNLIEEWCIKNNTHTLAMGHHKKDQAETFLLRLIRGSGLYGLSGILPVSKRGALTIIRPNLEKTPEVLREFLNNKNIRWVEDPSNQNLDFLRVKVRKYLPELESAIGLSSSRLAKTAQTLALSRSFIEVMTDKTIAEITNIFGEYGATISIEKFVTSHLEMQFNVLAKLIKNIGKSSYTPESDKMIRLCNNLEKKDFSGVTLGKCEVFIFDNKIWITPELKIKNKPSKKQWEDFLENNPEYKKLKLPFKMRLSLMNIKPI